MHHRFGQDCDALSQAVVRRHGYFLNRLSVMSQEYVLLQISKLHDPAVTRRSVNLSLAYIVGYGAWEPALRADLSERKGRLDALGKQLLAPARNKVLCHNDLNTIVNAESLGEFEPGLDEQYFIELQEFVNLIHDQVIGGPYPFADQAPSDVRLLLGDLTRAATCPREGRGR